MSPAFWGLEFLRLKLEKVGITTRPFRHDLNQIPYDYTVEVTNRLKGLDLIERKGKRYPFECRVPKNSKER